ncbi:hypothetical protein MASR2M8_18290 [Opitutaceae bacterium]
MSLNRSEQLVFDYLQANPEEKSHWIEKTKAAGRLTDPHEASSSLADALWSYYEERAVVAAPFKDRVRHEGLQRTSMRNLAELLLRLWAPPKPKSPTRSNSGSYSP